MKSSLVAIALWFIVCLSCVMVGAYIGVIGYKLGRLDCLMEHAT